MAKGTHREAQRIELPNGMWCLLYADGSLKLAGYDRRLHVMEVLNRDGGGHVFVRVEAMTENPRTISSRPSDLVTVERGVVAALERVASK